ncbi:hypothetical protein Acsp01_15070 [Actinoplanes sp. NBRC 101535]|nr:hypothetical protein Acsp01_15070 [Actinoplanes sp. NBRC 101535]
MRNRPGIDRFRPAGAKHPVRGPSSPVAFIAIDLAFRPGAARFLDPARKGAPTCTLSGADSP